MRADIEHMKQVVLEAGKLFGDRKSAGEIYIKGAADYVTQVDVTVQQFVSRRLGELYPDIQFMGEEQSNAGIDLDGQVWVLDPVDGTTNLIHDYQTSAVSLALLENREPVFGIVYNPFHQELFWAEKGKGCFLNGRPVFVSKAERPENSMITIGTSPYYKELAEENFQLFQHIFLNFQDIRRSGSAALDLAYVACGRTEAYLERRLKIWDFAAGVLLVKEAGGMVLDYTGNPLQMGLTADLVAGNGVIPQILVGEYIQRRKGIGR